MLWGLPPHATEDDVSFCVSLLSLFYRYISSYSMCILFPQIRFAIDQLEGPQPADVRLMKKKTGENPACEEPFPSL